MASLSRWVLAGSVTLLVVAWLAASNRSPEEGHGSALPSPSSPAPAAGQPGNAEPPTGDKGASRHGAEPGPGRRGSALGGLHSLRLRLIPHESLGTNWMPAGGYSGWLHAHILDRDGGATPMSFQIDGQTTSVSVQLYPQSLRLELDGEQPMYGLLSVWTPTSKIIDVVFGLFVDSVVEVEFEGRADHLPVLELVAETRQGVAYRGPVRGAGPHELPRIWAPYIEVVLREPGERAGAGSPGTSGGREPLVRPRRHRFEAGPLLQDRLFVVETR